MPENDETKKITALLYEHNLEIALKNKTLSLLEKLYQTSILTLSPEEMAQTATHTIREDLNLEFTGVLILNKETDSLVPLAFSSSDRLKEVLNKVNVILNTLVINEISKRNFFKQVIYDKKDSITDDFEEVWKDIIKPENLAEIKTKSHIKTMLLHPLMTGKEVLGVLLFGLNRDYDTLNTFEKESIKSFINVIALSLDKAYLYKKLQDANEKLKSLDKLKTEFLSLASHQLRSPLTTINGYTSMLLEGDFGVINEKQKEMIDRILQSGKHLTKVIEDLLNVSKIEQGGMQYVMQPFDFEKMTRDLVNDFSVTATKKGLKLSLENDNKMPYTVDGDTEKLRQVILNLIDNSIKYTKEGNIKINLAKDEETKKIRWSVNDTGMGMMPETKDSLFSKFARGENVKINTTGSGLGLYLAKIIIDAHKGKVWAESEGKGKGSTFFVELPTA